MFNMKVRLRILFFMSILSISMYSQWVPDKLTDSSSLPEEENNKLTVNADIVGFFKNNEYFSPIVKGETLPGVYIRPTVSYQAENKLRATFGITGLYYSGDQQKEGTYVFNGIFARLQYAVHPHLHLVFGNYYGGVNHRLPEPLYKWERQLTEKPEGGLQLKYEDEKYFADVWLNWQRFIQKGDSVPEVMTFGLSSSAALTRPEKSLKITIPFWLVIHHQGGQIDVSEEKMIVCGNAATGICSEYVLRPGFIRSVGINLYLLGYYDKLPDPNTRPYGKGWGVYPTLQINTSFFQFMAGYWYAKKFYSFEGEPLFASFNPEYPSETLVDRSLLTLKGSYSKDLHESFSVGGQVESYSDMKSGRTDYSFSVYLRFTPRFFVR